jgi:hypothetical protein
MLQTKESVKNARTALEAETHEVVQVSNRLSDNLTKAGKKIWGHLLFIWAIVIVSGISYFVISYQTPTVPNQAPKEEVAPERAPAFSAIPERQDLLDLLNKMRDAQLKKDIHLFLEAYDPHFPNLAHRRELMLSIWQRYDYVDSQFQLSDLTIKNSTLILGRVTWVIKARDRQSNDMKIFSKSYQVYFSKDSGKWLILKFGSDEDKENLG